MSSPPNRHAVGHPTVRSRSRRLPTMQGDNGIRWPHLYPATNSRRHGRCLRPRYSSFPNTPTPGGSAVKVCVHERSPSDDQREEEDDNDPARRPTAQKELPRDRSLSRDRSKSCLFEWNWLQRDVRLSQERKLTKPPRWARGGHLCWSQPYPTGGSCAVRLGVSARDGRAVCRSILDRRSAGIRSCSSSGPSCIAVPSSKASTLAASPTTGCRGRRLRHIPSRTTTRKGCRAS
jgi:hypothetical protein